jgi:hypothetical protein
MEKCKIYLGALCGRNDRVFYLSFFRVKILWKQNTASEIMISQDIPMNSAP